LFEKKKNYYSNVVFSWFIDLPCSPLFEKLVDAHTDVPASE